MSLTEEWVISLFNRAESTVAGSRAQALYIASAIEAEVLRLNGVGGEAETFEQWNAKQHGDPEEIGFLQALRIAYCSGQDSVYRAKPQQAAPGAVLEGWQLTVEANMARLRWAEHVFGSIGSAIHSTESVSYSRALNDLRRAISSIEESLSAAPKPQGE